MTMQDEVAMTAALAARRVEGSVNRRAAAPVTDRERRRELWDAGTIRRDRLQASDLKVAQQWGESRDRLAAMPDPTPPRMATGEQVRRMGELSVAVGLPLNGVGVTLTQEAAQDMIRDLEFAAGPDVVADLDARLAAPAVSAPVVAVQPDSAPQVLDVRAAAAGMPAAHGLTPDQVAELRTTPKPVGEWKTGADAITSRQRFTLRGRGYADADLAGMSKADASRHIAGDLSLSDVTRRGSQTASAGPPVQRTAARRRSSEPKRTG